MLTDNCCQLGRLFTVDSMDGHQSLYVCSLRDEVRLHKMREIVGNKMRYQVVRVV